MAKKSTLRPTPIIYEIGVDVSEEQYRELVHKVGDWFSQIRKTTEPVALAKATIDACLKGVKPSDPTKTWEGAETLSFAKRIRMACRFDLDSMAPIVTGDEKKREKKEKDKERELAKRREAAVETNYPEEYGKVRAVDIKYGDDLLAFFTTKELENRSRLREGYLSQFPQLDNVAAEGKLNMLLDLLLMQERLRLRNLQTEKKSEVSDIEYKLSANTKQIVELEKALGIHPDQLAKAQKEKEGGSIGDAVRRLEEMGGYVALREQAFAEELIELYQMYMTPSPRSDMGGYQLDDVGLYGLTKTRVVCCPRCGQKNWAGLAIDEIEGWLIAEGHLKPLSEDEEKRIQLQLPAYVNLREPVE